MAQRPDYRVEMRGPPNSHRDLEVYQAAFSGMVAIMRMTNLFPSFEKWEMVAQMRAASRSVCACIAEAWRKRNYPAAFASKITDAESEAAETQTWLDAALAHEYITKADHAAEIERYDHILAQLVNLRRTKPNWKKP